MNFLFLHQWFSIPGKGEGDELRFFRIGRHLASQGHQVTVITGNSKLNLSHEEKRIRLLQTDGMAILTFNINYAPEMTPRQKRRALLSYARWTLRQGKRLPKPDLIFASSPPLTVALPALALARRFMAPLIFEVREHWVEAAVNRGTLRFKPLINLARRLERRLYENSSLLVALSHEIAQSIRAAAAKPAQLVLIPAGTAEEQLVEQYCRLLERFTLI